MTQWGQLLKASQELSLVCTDIKKVGGRPQAEPQQQPQVAVVFAVLTQNRAAGAAVEEVDKVATQ